MSFVGPTALLASILWSQVVAQTPDPSAISAAVRQLSDPDFSVRQTATIFLWEAGEDAAPALRRAAASADREVRYRVELILDKFRYGIYADTPPDVVRLIEQYREGDVNVRREILGQLQQRDAVPTMMALLESEPDDEFRQQLTTQILRDAEKVIPRLVREKQFGRVEQLLRLGMATDDGMTLYLSYLVLRGEADAKLASLQQQQQQGTLDTSDSRLLAHLLRARGDLTAAKTMAEEIGARALLRSVLYDLGDWKGLADLEANPNELAALSSFQLIERLGFVAAYQRLAGEEAALETTLDKIRALGDNETLRWHVAESLLINGRFQEGIDQMQSANAPAAFRLLMAQARYREAFVQIGLGDTREAREAWFSQLTQDAQSDDKERRDRFDLGLQAARGLARVGLTDESRRYFTGLAKAAEKDEDGHRQRLRSLIGVASRSGFRDLALETTVTALAVVNNLYPLSAAYPEHYEAASLWWEFLSREFATESRLDTLRRIDRLIYGVREKLSLEEMLSLADAADRYGATLDPVKQGKQRLETARASMRHGHQDAAKTQFVSAAELSTEAALKLGDLAAEDKQWTEAVDWYRRTWERDNTQFLAFYLLGKTMQEAGDVDRGRQQCQLAVLMPLSPAARRTFAQGLHERGYKSDAADQWRLMVRTGDLHSWYTNDAAKQLGNAVSGQDPLRAVDGWQRLLLSALKTSSNFTEIEGYLQLPQLIHKVRARFLLKEGRHEEALAELRISHAALPGGIKLAEDLFPKFDAAGMKDAVDPLFEATYVLYEQLCEDYPEVASHHNNLAWLAARCDRRLDEAFEHATRAVQLAPDSMAYLDTLAEVHFRQGNVEEAIRLEQKCLAREPENAEFIRQLKRFQGEDVEEADDADQS